MSQNAAWWDEQHRKIKEALTKVNKANAAAAKIVGKGNPKTIVTGIFNSQGITMLFGDGEQLRIKQRAV